MANYFLDSSGLVKRYVNETGSMWINHLFDPALNHEIYIVRVTCVEIVAALSRRVLGKSILPSVASATIQMFRRELLTDYQILEVVEPLTDRAMALAEKHRLRGYDAIQLAAASELNMFLISHALPALIFISADKELNKAAMSEGLLPDDPNLH